MNQNKKIPLRKCVGCGEQKNKNELIRIVRDVEENVSIDPTGKANGRGAYICCNTNCLEKAWKTHALDRSFKINVSANVYDELRKELSLIEK